MTLELAPMQPQYVPEVGRIAYEAFYGISTAHGFAPDFPTIEVATQVVGMLSSRADFYAVVALLDGRPVGVNFLSRTDSVAGVGPITVDPVFQGRGIGRALMQDVLQHARSSGIDQVRLLQDAFNVTSLSLYTTLGFDAREEVALMEHAPDLSHAANGQETGVRPMAAGDVSAADALCRRLYKTSRSNEVTGVAQMGLPAFVREQEGRITGYLVPGLLGHGVAETEEDALLLIREAARVQSSPIRFFCPLSEARLFRQTLRAGARVVKVMTYMSVGPYEAPDAVWMPSVAY